MSVFDREHQLREALSRAGYPTTFKADAAKLGLSDSKNVEIRVSELEAACTRLGIEIPAPVEEPEWEAADFTEGGGDGEPEGGWEAADFADPGVTEVSDPPQPEAEPISEAAKGRRVATTGEQEERLATRLFNILDKIAPALPAEVALSYLHCWRLADWKSGEFYVSHERMAERLGAKNRSTGKRVMRTLVAAGVVHIKVKGRKGQATLYRLAPMNTFKRERVIAAVYSTWMGLNPKMLKQAQETGSRETRIAPEDGFVGDP